MPQPSPIAAGADSAATPARHAGSFRHVPALDGLRGVSWVLVFTTHASLFPTLALAPVGMFLFFGLSGFLITSLLVDEFASTGRASLVRFYGRRALRLLPALYLFLAVWFVVVLAAGHSSWITAVPGGGGGPEPTGVAAQGVAAAAAYATNWFAIFGWFSGYVPLGHLWSLSIEEQLYIVWAPLLVFAVSRHRRFATVLALALAAGSLLEAVVVHHGTIASLRVSWGTDTRAAPFLVGSACALWRAGGNRLLEGRIVGAVARVGGFVLLGFGVYALGDPFRVGLFELGWCVVAVAAPLTVVSVAAGRGGIVSRALSGRAITYLGRRSYALYLWHYVWLGWFARAGLAGVAAALCASLACAELSWRLVESRALRAKARLRWTAVRTRVGTLAPPEPAVAG